MRIIVIDDDKLVHIMYKSIFKDQNQIEVLKYFICAREALEYIQENKVELIFLDIEMPHFTGLDFLNELNKKNIVVNVVVATSMGRYALNVINDKNLIYFIKKPLHEYTIKEAIKSVKEKIELTSNKPLETKSTKEKIDTHTFLNCNRRIINLCNDNIEFIKSSKGGVTVITDKESLNFSYTLKEIEDKLPSSFIRIHKSYIINLKKVELVFDGLVIIKKHHIPIGRTYKSNFKEHFT